MTALIHVPEGVSATSLTARLGPNVAGISYAEYPGFRRKFLIEYQGCESVQMPSTWYSWPI